MSDDAKAPGLPTIDVNEYGGKKDGVKQSMNRRLFMQLLVYRGGSGQTALDAFREKKVPAVVYADTMDPTSFAVLTWHEDPSHFISAVRPILAKSADGTLRTDFGMLGRSYATGHEPELEWTLLKRPIENVMNETYRWHVWYPLRRKGAFAKLEPIDQSHILREHAALGIAYGQQELATDIRLACHGIDAGDNEFVIGPRRQRPASALASRPSDAEDAADERVHREDGPVLRRLRPRSKQRPMKRAFIALAIFLAGCSANVSVQAPPPAPTTTTTAADPNDAKLDEVARIHGAPGPWAVAGYRMSEYALAKLGLQRGSFDLDITHHTPKQVKYSCIADGAAAYSGASIGKLNLSLVDATPETVETEYRNKKTGAKGDPQARCVVRKTICQYAARARAGSRPRSAQSAGERGLRRSAGDVT